MNTVCIETSGAYCSVAAQAGERQAALHERLDRQHNQHLLRMLDEVCRAVEMAPQAVTKVLFGAGPGSFTGIRLGAAAAQALALASGAALGAVPSSLVLARSAQVVCPHAAGFVTCIPSRASLVYVARFGLGKEEGSDLVCLDDDELTDVCPEGLATLADNVVWVGAVPPWAEELPALNLLSDVSAQASAMLSLATHEGVCWGDAALPRYMPGDSPWLTTAERAARG